MARRARKSEKQTFLIVGVIVAGLAVLVFMFLGAGGSEPYRTTDDLDVASYMENSGSLRGNVYRLEAEVLNALADSPTSGRLLSIGVGDQREIVPVIVPPEFDGINLQRGQKFIFLLEVDKNGILTAKALTKS